MSADTDLDDLAALLPQLSTREAFAELETAQRAAEQAPPQSTIIPEPEFPHAWPHPKGGIARFPCALGCGWAHEHDSYAEDPDPISVPLTATSEDIGRIFGERAERRAARVRASVETAIRGHFADAHPGQEPPKRRIA
ncbi:hypothetical protein ABZ923_37310 [Streptomyces sp. NPDC046881]|uniref:hypothetical protein n=1 Tax=Streptomyces sp. NPDC046881 TaxID=3155374 RepID=UPI0033EEF3C3